MTTADKILKVCESPNGHTRAELAELLGKSGSQAVGIAEWLIANGRLHKSGVRRAYRYFTDKAHADAWALIAPEAFKAQLRATKEAERIARNAAYQRNKATTHAKRPKEQAAVAVPVAPAAPSLEQSRPKPEAKPAKVSWPAHVSIQVIPTPPSRFAFQPREGWRGQITSDWMARRQQETDV
ncbi:MAG: hypothetical protein U5L73_11525 [Rhodoferax sp.]|uniref:hypothetical protein n=1 Tax=Rhodoferax sp. TaxID=50421 RepID=UPI002ACDD3F4|nr:hypothetical protein [Rhodoferax sp.]MDZ7892373.1 hypothetical protein [Rhodoferax sp.]